MQWLVKFKESLLSIIPIVIIILVLHFTSLVTLSNNELILFSVSAVLVVIGLAIFGQGVDHSISPIGEYVGASITKTKSIALIIIVFFLLGTFIVVAEPDVLVLAEQIPISNWVFIIVVGVGAGVLMVIGVLRILFEKSLKVYIYILYGFVFMVACLVDKSFIPLAFDSGGVSAGPMTVPFILALGIGIASSRHGKSNSDCFGLTALCSLGPVISVMILSLFIDKDQLVYSGMVINENPDIVSIFMSTFVNAFGDVALSLVPIFVFFLIYDLIVIKLPIKTLLKLLVGLVYTYFGLVIFLAAINGGFLSVGYLIGEGIGSNENFAVLLPIVGLCFGLFTVLAEPSVPVLVGQIKNVSDGVIKKSSVYIALSLGVSIAVCLSMVRIIYKFDLLYYLIPGYIIAIALTFITPDLYTSIAFDSGGVASGAMNAAFIVPLATGACYAINGNYDRVMSDAFGVVAMVTLAPVISIQLLGIISVTKQTLALKQARQRIYEENDNQIIHFD